MMASWTGQEVSNVEMTGPGMTDLSSFQRSHVVKTGLRAAGMTTFLLVLYYLLPIEHRAHQSVLLRLSVAMALFVAIVASEVRLIPIHDQPTLRAVVAMATIIPLFVVLFVWIYLTMSRSDPASFGIPLTRSSALYFTVTVFSTVGFGDIVPKTDTARLVCTVQMLGDLAVVAVVIRLILGAAARGIDRKREPT